MSDTPGNVRENAEDIYKFVHRCDLDDAPCQDGESTPVDNDYPHAAGKRTLSMSRSTETIKTTPEDAPTSNRGLTKSAPTTAKTSGVSMAGPQHKTDPRPGIKPDDHRHGSTKGFHQGCRERCCLDAIAKYEKLTKYRRHNGIVWAIPSLGVQRRIQALMALGWTSTDIANECGLNNRNGVLRILYGQKGKPCRWVERKTYRRFAEVYERLCMTLPEHTASRARTRSLAAKKGYQPPLVWDDIDTDPEPKGAAQPDLVDKVKVQRVLDGIRADCTPTERLAVIDAWTGSLIELQRVTGWNVHRILRDRKAA